MLYSTLMLMMSSAFLMLRLSPGGSFPRPLSEAEERKYLEAWLQGDLEARNVLIERNLRLVAHIIKKYYTHYDDTDDLISIGTIGLIKGINTYRPDKGVRLATYASKCAENEILCIFAAHAKTQPKRCSQTRSTRTATATVCRSSTSCPRMRTWTPACSRTRCVRRCGAASARYSMRASARSSACAMPLAAANR